MPDIASLLGDEAESLLGHTAKAIPRDELSLPGPDFIDRVFVDTDRNPTVVRNLGALLGHGRLAGTGYVSILPVDQGIEHSRGGLLRAEPGVLRPDQHREARHRGRLQRGRDDLRRARHGVAPLRAPHPVHREAQPQRAADLPEPVRPGACSARAQQACDLGAVGIGATIYFGSEESTRQLQEVSEAFAEAHRARHVHRAVVLPAQLRRSRRTASTTRSPPT